MQKSGKPLKFLNLIAHMNNKNSNSFSSPNLQDIPAPDTNRILFVAMLPAMVMAVIFFGIGSLKVMTVSVLTCLILEYLIKKYIRKIPAKFGNGSALITGILLAFNLPAGLPVLLVIAGSVAVVAFSQKLTEKLPGNPFNAVLISRLLLRILFPVQMTTWQAVITETDSLTGFTPIGILKQGIANGKTMTQITAGTNFPRYFDMFWGNVNGTLGEISVIAILIGAFYLLAKKVITWHIPIAFLGTFFLVEGILWIVAPGSFMDPIFHLISGGMTLMAFFMATDPFTTPVSSLGKLLFGAGIGLLAILIRNLGAYPEEIFLAVLVMNGLTPLINLKTIPKQSSYQ